MGDLLITLHILGVYNGFHVLDPWYYYTVGFSLFFFFFIVLVVILIRGLGLWLVYLI